VYVRDPMVRQQAITDRLPVRGGGPGEGGRGATVGKVLYR
jgi:hypothetical protein